MIGIVISFFVGAIVGRYFEKILEFFKFMREDLQRVRDLQADLADDYIQLPKAKKMLNKKK